MKVKSLLLYTLLGALCLSCSDDNAGQGGSASLGKAVTFGTDLAGYTVATRVSQDGAAWSTGDAIGVLVLDASSHEPVFSSPSLYSCLEAGTDVTFTSENPIHLDQGQDPVTFVACYPYDAAQQGIYRSVDLADQSAGTAALDLMYAASAPYTETDTEEDAHIQLSFTHRLTKLRMRVLNMQGAALQVQHVAIAGMAAKATLDLRTATLAATGDDEEITPCLDQTTGYYEALILPAELKPQHRLTFQLGGQQLEWAFTQVEGIDLPYFNRGWQYTFTVYVNDQGAVEVGRLDSMEDGNTSTPWSNGETLSGVASTLPYTFFPLQQATAVQTDTELKLTFSRGGAPRLGTSGCIRIFDAQTHEQVDLIDMADKHTPFATESSDTEPRLLHTWMNIIGMQSAKSGSRNRKLVINYYPVEVEGNTLIIKPHCQRMQPGRSYYVTLDRQAVQHAGFEGVAAGEWTFSTRALPQGAEVRVSHTDTAADFYTLQGAIDYLATAVDSETAKTVTLDAGTYKEVVYLRDQDNITVKGATGNAADVVLKYRNYNALNGSTNDGMEIDHNAPLGTDVSRGCNRAVLVLAGNADRIRFEDITLQNAYGWDDDTTPGTVTYNEGQAEAVLIRNSGAVEFVGCRLLGNQDTLIAGNGSARGYSRFNNCYIAGGTDFIWSCGQVALFDGCHLEAISHTRAVMQARVPEGALGYVFSNCRFTAPTGSTTAALIYSTDNNDDHLTFAACSFDATFVTHFVGHGTLHPAQPTATTGCKMYACTLADGTTDAYTALEAGWQNAVHRLSDADYGQHYGSAQTVMAAAGYATPQWFR